MVGDEKKKDEMASASLRPEPGSPEREAVEDDAATACEARALLAELVGAHDANGWTKKNDALTEHQKIVFEECRKFLAEPAPGELRNIPELVTLVRRARDAHAFIEGGPASVEASAVGHALHMAIHQITGGQVNWPLDGGRTGTHPDAGDPGTVTSEASPITNLDGPITRQAPASASASCADAGTTSPDPISHPVEDREGPYKVERRQSKFNDEIVLVITGPGIAEREHAFNDEPQLNVEATRLNAAFAAGQASSSAPPSGDERLVGTLADFLGEAIDTALDFEGATFDEVRKLVGCILDEEIEAQASRDHDAGDEQ